VRGDENKGRNNKSESFFQFMTNEQTQQPEEGQLIGKITHYFGRIGVAVIELSDALKTGDTIRIAGGADTDFNQTVGSMEIDHKKVETAKAGDSAGLKVDQKVREGYKVYKV
jgi:putative protease